MQQIYLQREKKDDVCWLNFSLATSKFSSQSPLQCHSMKPFYQPTKNTKTFYTIAVLDGVKVIIFDCMEILW